MIKSWGFLEVLAGLAVRYPRRMIALALTVCACVSLLILNVRMNPDPISLLPEDAGPMKRFNELLTTFASGDRLFVAVEAADDHDKERSRQLIETVAAQIEQWSWQNPELNGQSESMIESMFGRHDPSLGEAQYDLIGGNGFLFLDDAGVDDVVSKMRPKYIRKRLQTGAPASVPAQLRERDVVGLWTNTYLPAWKSMQGEQAPLTEDNGYVLSRDGRIHVLMLHAAHSIKNMEFTGEIAPKLQVLKAEIDADQQWAGLTFHLAGGYVQANVDFKETIQSSILTVITSITGIVILFGLAYRSLRLVVFIAVATVPAVTATLGIAGVIFSDGLSVLISAFAAILLGLGVDYIIHIYNAYGWALRHPQEHDSDLSPRAQAALAAVQHTGAGIALGCLTSTASFIVLATSNFRGLRELGVVAGIGLACMLALISIIIPALLAWVGPKKCTEAPLLKYCASVGTRRRGLLSFLTLACVGAVLMTSCMVSPWFRFDYDLRNLRPASSATPSYVELGRRLGISFGGHDMLIQGQDEKAVVTAVHKVVTCLTPLQQGLPVTFAEDVSLTDLRTDRCDIPLQIPVHPDEFIARHAFEFPWGIVAFERVEEHTLYGAYLYEEYDGAPELLQAGVAYTCAPILHPVAGPLQAIPELARQTVVMQRLHTEVDWQGIEAVRAASSEQQRKRYAAFLADIQAMQQRCASGQPLLLSELSGGALAELVRSVFHKDEVSGKISVRLSLPTRYNTSLIPLLEFREALCVPFNEEGEVNLGNDVHGSLCGGPSLVYFLERTIIENFVSLTLIALAVTLLLLSIALRNLVQVTLIMGTLLLGIIGMVAAMHWVGLPWNLLNIMVLPLIIGIGIDNGIHFMHHLTRQPRTRAGLRKTLTEIGHPIIMTALTSIVGFGSLLVSSYRGIQSIGSLASIGIFACLLGSLVFLPTVLMWLGYKDEHE